MRIRGKVTIPIIIIALAAAGWAAIRFGGGLWNSPQGDTCYIFGRVLTESGEPLAGWSVSAIPMQAPNTPQFRTDSDAAGAFRFDGCQLRRPYRVKVRQRESLDSTPALETSVFPSSMELVLLIPPERIASGRIRGVLHDVSGNVPRDARIQAYWGRGDFNRHISDPLSISYVDVDPTTGEFDAGMLRADYYQLLARADHYRDEIIFAREVKAGQMIELGEVVLPQEALISGSIEMAPSRRAESTTGSIGFRLFKASPTYGADAHELQRYICGNCPPGRWDLDPGDYVAIISDSAAGGGTVATRITIEPGKSTVIDVNVPAAETTFVDIIAADGAAHPELDGNIALHILDSAALPVILVEPHANFSIPKSFAFRLSPGTYTLELLTTSGDKFSEPLQIVASPPKEPVVVRWTK